MTYSVTRIAAYIEEELAIDHLVLPDVGQVLLELIVFKRQLLKVRGVELLKTRDSHRAELPVAEQLFVSTEGVTHEVHSAVVVWRQMELTLDREYDVEVFLRLDKISEVRCDHL
jgi:hypothetical protein